MSRLDKLKQQNAELQTAERALYDHTLNALGEMIDDSRRAAGTYLSARDVLDEIDAEFEKATALDKTDVKILFLAAAIQTSRWVLLGTINGAVSDKLKESRMKDNDSSIKEWEKKQRDKYAEKHKNDPHKKSRHRDWANIVYDGVPYDVTAGSPLFGEAMGGGEHRVHTLGHDPILGWLFGTMNILSDTITLETFKTYTVCMEKGKKRWTSKSSLMYAFTETIDSVKEDYRRLPAAVFAQWLHLGSDVLTKKGLPVPLLEAFSPDFAGKLYKQGYDSLVMMKDVAVVGAQAALAALINMLIAAIHGLYYDPKKWPNRDLFEVKTRKILMWSNVISSIANALTVAGMEASAYLTGNPELAKKGWEFLDVGGYIVTMYRLVTDMKFIAEVKRRFLSEEWQKKVIGEEYVFLKEEFTE